MDHVCRELSPPNLEGLQTCVQWAEFSYIPPLSSADRDFLLQWAFGLFALVWIVKKCIRFFG